MPEAGVFGIALVMSLALVGDAAFCGIATWALSSVFGAGLLLDCRPIGVGEIMEGAAGAGACVAGLALLSAGALAGAAGSAEFSIAGISGALPVSSSVIAILKVPSTITTTLAPTSSERILEVMFEGSLLPALPLSMAMLGGFGGGLRSGLRRLLVDGRGGGGLRGTARGGDEAR